MRAILTFMGRAAALLSLAVLAGSCATTPPDTSVAVEGTYLGSVSIESENLPARLEIAQQGTRLTGTLALAGGLTARGGGEIAGRGLTFGLAYDQGCPGQVVLTGRATPDGRAIEGSVRASDCTGILGGAFSLKRLDPGSR